MREFLTRACAAGFVLSVAAQIVSLFTPEMRVAPWFLPVLIAVVPLGVAGAVVSLGIGRRHGVWGRYSQLRFVMERCPGWAVKLNYAVMALALIRLVLYMRGPRPPAGTAFADQPLGPFSAVCMAMYVALGCLFWGGLGASHEKRQE